MPVVHTMVQTLDPPARRLFAETGNEGMNERSKGRHEQIRGKAHGKEHVLKEGFIDTGRMGEKDALDHDGLLLL